MKVETLIDSLVLQTRDRDDVLDLLETLKTLFLKFPELNADS